MTQNEFLKSLDEHFDRVTQRVEKSFYYLPEEELNAKPNEKTWSVAQCIEHLNLTHAHYLKKLQEVEKKAGSQEIDHAFYHSLKGRFFVRGMAPKDGGLIAYKMKTAKALRPLAEREPGAIVLERVVFEDFMRDIAEFKRLLEVFKRVDIKKTKIPTLLGPLVKLSVGDALAFLSAHMDRHLLQAEKTAKGQKS